MISQPSKTTLKKIYLKHAFYKTEFEQEFIWMDCVYTESGSVPLGYRPTWSTANVRHYLPQVGGGKGNGLLRGFLGTDY